MLVRVTLSRALVVLLAAALSLPVSAEPLRLAMSGTFQPFSSTDVDGTLVGLDADIATEIARRLGREPVLVQTDWAGIQAGLQSRKYDLICGSMAITDARLETMHFTLPYYVSGAQVFAVAGTSSLEGIRIGVTEASTYERFIKDHPETFGEATVLRFGGEAESVAAMNAGKIDALVSDRIVGGFYIDRGGAAEIVPYGDLLYREVIGIAARKSDGALVRQVNVALLEMLQDGTYERIYRKWVGADPDLSLLMDAWSGRIADVPREVGGERQRDDATRFADSLPSMAALLAEGARLTIVLSLITAIVALFTGALVGVGSVSRSTTVRRFSDGYVTLVRGTPLLVQLFISYYAIATLINDLAGAEVMGAFGAALLALVANTTAYNAETIRGGIASVDSGQWDAAASIGMPRGLILRRVILPQALRDSVASLGNNAVVLVKDTSLVGAITLIELTYAARNIVFQTGKAFTPFLVAAFFYLAIIAIVTVATRFVERHLGRSRSRTGASV
jgi:arginine/lysine/histidine/glutamine transport system substrate-binding/permease protein